jgi:hypothetical protein
LAELPSDSPRAFKSFVTTSTTAIELPGSAV